MKTYIVAILDAVEPHIYPMIALRETLSKSHLCILTTVEVYSLVTLITSGIRMLHVAGPKGICNWHVCGHGHMIPSFLDAAHALHNITHLKG